MQDLVQQMYTCEGPGQISSSTPVYVILIVFGHAQPGVSTAVVSMSVYTWRLCFQHISANTFRIVWNAA